MTPRRQRQQGAALITAIFLLVVLASLGAYMVSIGGTQETAVNRSLQAARVYFGAKAGLDWAIHRAVNAPATMCSTGTATQTTFTPSGIGFTGVSVAVNCSYAVLTDGAAFNYYYITSTATYGDPGTVDYAQRMLEATISNKF